MKKELEVVIHVMLEDKDCLWDTISEEKQEEMNIALNDRALRSIGYIPVAKKNG